MYIRIGSKPSLLDLILSNQPGHVDSVETKKSVIADHCSVRFQYHTKELPERIQFIKIREWRRLVTGKLMDEIEKNENLNHIFRMDNPNEIAETLVKEMNTIIETIAPLKIVQKSSKNNLYSFPETEDIRKDTEAQLENAIRSNDVEEWRLFRMM